MIIKRQDRVSRNEKAPLSQREESLQAADLKPRVQVSIWKQTPEEKKQNKKKKQLTAGEAGRERRLGGGHESVRHRQDQQQQQQVCRCITGRPLMCTVRL